jgi:hypothetical protein
VFLFELYNFASATSHHQSDFGDLSSKIAFLNARGKGLESFYKSKGGGRKRPREGDDSGDPSPSPVLVSGGRQAQGSVFDDSVVRNELFSAGYHVEAAWVELGAEPLDRVGQFLVTGSSYA